MLATDIQRVQRCAIYTRKSTQDQWDREFNSIESQRDICSAFITCQEHKDWIKLPQPYDDSGQSGSSLGRPALQRLLRDIERGEIDIVVIYKIDRLTRSLADFLRLIEVFDCHGVKFVSVTQTFDTSDSMGRLLLNILLTFAQFERELIADRLRDKVAASKRRGKFNGGRPPLGYDLIDHRLIVNPEEAEQVRSIFRRFLEGGTCTSLSRQLKSEGVRGKVHVTRAGAVIGGQPASNGMLYHLLKNPIYIGRVPHKGNSYPGEHEAIIDEKAWHAAQALTDSRRMNGADLRHARNFLKGILCDSHGRRMIIAASGTGHYVHRYYESKQTPWSVSEGIKRYRVRADSLEQLVIAVVKEAVQDRETIRAALRDIGRSCEELDLLARRAAAARANLENARFEVLYEVLRSLIVECEVSQHSLLLVLRSIEVARFIAWDGNGLFRGDRAAWTVNQPTFTVRRAIDDVSFGRLLVMPVDPIEKGRRGTPDPHLVKLIQTARRAQAAVDGERDLDMKALARHFRCRQARFCRILRLNYLAPDIVAGILAGAQPHTLTCSRLLHGPFPLDWDLQRQVFGFPAQPNQTLKAKRDRVNTGEPGIEPSIKERA